MPDNIPQTTGNELVVFTPDSIKFLNRRRLRSCAQGFKSDLGTAFVRVLLREVIEPREAASESAGKVFIWTEPESLSPEALERITLSIIKEMELCD